MCSRGSLCSKEACIKQEAWVAEEACVVEEAGVAAQPPKNRYHGLSDTANVNTCFFKKCTLGWRERKGSGGASSWGEGVQKKPRPSHMSWRRLLQCQGAKRRPFISVLFFSLPRFVKTFDYGYNMSLHNLSLGPILHTNQSARVGRYYCTGEILLHPFSHIGLF